MSELGERIRSKRKEKGMSQRDLAEKVGVGFPHLSKIENGAETPSDELLDKIADALDDDVDELMTIARRVSPDLVEMVIDNDVTRNFLRRVRNGDIPMSELEKLMNKKPRRQ